VLAIGVEGGKLRLELAQLTEIDSLLPALMSDDQLPALMRRRQSNHQGGDHSFKLFPIAMRQKEAPRLI
jgi:hypothetical protein